jgi:hypothetical protein
MKTQITGNVGLYFACYQLSKLGLNVMPTSRNAKGSDVIAYTSDQSQFVTFQVKAMTKLNNISLGKSKENLDSNWWLIVVDAYSENPTTYVMRPEEVAATAKLYQKVYWAQSKGFDLEDYRNRWDRITSELENETNER